MVEDRFFSAVARVVRRVLNDTAEIDFRALYPARVVEWTSSDVFPSGLVGVVFVSDDVGRAAERLVSKKGIPVLPPVPGMSYEPRPGTQCLVGWQGGDERFPYATGWLGLGGATSLTQTVDTTLRAESVVGTVDVVAPLVNLGTAPAAAFVMLGSAGPALTTLFGSMSGYFTAASAAFTAIGAASLVPAVAAACTAAATAATTAATAVSTYSGQASSFIATRVKAT